MNKFVFLDIDGVLNSDRTVFAYNAITHAGRVKHDILLGKLPEPMFDPIAVSMLANAQRKIGFKIVISSTWREMLSLDNFVTMFSIYGWDTTDIIIGKTDSGKGIRGEQIKRWLGSHGGPEYRYAILDDSTDMLEEQVPFFVNTDYSEGFSFANYKKLFEVFGENYTQSIAGLYHFAE